ncbi:MAG: aspartate--tRNA ligase [Rhodobiaceae bacterium]|nr:aspartate--tRNA ligase [Rhodobiaceae bacterium]RPF97937.1 MAG: aspartate--tRNA ligase [Rhizobiales bacterium TMED227]|tara:strand:+ start:995 stop:2785 length:1791 start_codon:yes stop_codon:yes gene_type:complete
MHNYRTHKCDELRSDNIGQTVRLSGWVHRIRDHGDLLFIDLRDHYGLTQCVVEPGSKVFELVETIRSEWVICITGTVRARLPETVNETLKTGEIELFIDNVDILSKAEELPLPVFGEPDYPEDIRLKYRFLDLRRQKIHNNIILRSKIIQSIRKRMTDQGFNEYQTPILTASSPEGARDFLVPSRLHPGKFYALPQAPQQFKQLIMMAGFDRYFQIAPCFRDEDARADRSPGEFYQLDVEMSFVTQEDVFNAIEPVMVGVFDEFAHDMTVDKDIPKIPFMDALKKYGSDKPDLRIPIEMMNVSHIFDGSSFRIFANMIESTKDETEWYRKNEVWAIPAPKGGSRAFCDRMNSWAQGEGQPGLGYIFFKDGGGMGPIAKNIGEERVQELRDILNIGDEDAVFFVCGVPSKIYDFAGKARKKIGEDLDLIDSKIYKFCWIIDYPMYETDDDTGGFQFSHNPFSMPQGGLESLNNKDPLDILAYQYDIVCNGIELSSGAIRNHVPEIMERAFEIAGYDKSILEDKFSGMYNAMKFGAPPHGGIAPGIDRIVMLLAKEDNLREVTMFPMNQQAEDLLMGAPSNVSLSQLKELSIRSIEKK